MRFIATIAVAAIIALVAVIAIVSKRISDRKAEELEFQRGEKDLALSQLRVAKEELKTIRDTRGESALGATLALEEIDRLRDEHYETKGLQR